MQRKSQITVPVGTALFTLFVGMSCVGMLEMGLFVRVLFDYLGETAFPTIVAECFWIGVWVVAVELALLAVLSAVVLLKYKKEKSHTER